MVYDLGSALRELREDRGLTQVELAERSGTTDTVISRIENGRIEDPRLSTLDRLAEVLGISLSDFLEEAASEEESDGSVLSVLRDCREELRSDFHVQSLGLFGSMARGEGGSDSDVDLLVQYEEGHRDILNHSRLEEFLGERLNRTIDLVMDSDEARRGHPRIRDNIEEDLIRV